MIWVSPPGTGRAVVRPWEVAMSTASTESRYDATRAFTLAAAAALGGFLFGFDTAVINGAVDALSEDLSLGPLVTGFVVSTALLGAATGAFLAGRLADRWGRTRVMVLAASLFAVSAVGSAFAFGPWDLIVWRVVGGLGVGAASVIAPAYIAEISPAAIRGRLGSLFQMAIVTGILVALVSDLLIADAAGGAAEEWLVGLDAWRWMFLVELLPAVVFGVAALTIPESPRFLVLNGRLDEAREVLGQVIEGDVDDRVEQIRASARDEKRASFADIRRAGTYLMPVVWVGIALALFQQLVGINVIFYYSTSLWQSVGYEETNSLIYSVITGITNVVVTIVAILIIDKVGRRRLLLGGSVGMALSLGTLAVVFGSASVVDGEPALSTGEGYVALVAANLFVVAFALTWGPGLWVLLGEMFPNRVRGVALALAGAMNWLANFFVSTTFPTFADRLGLGITYGFYTVSAVVSFALVWRFLDETSGVELEDMGEDARAGRGKGKADRQAAQQADRDRDAATTG